MLTFKIYPGELGKRGKEGVMRLTRGRYPPSFLEILKSCLCLCICVPYSFLIAIIISFQKMYGFGGLGQVEVGMLPWRDERPNKQGKIELLSH